MAKDRAYDPKRQVNIEREERMWSKTAADMYEANQKANQHDIEMNQADKRMK
jgi:hypothetical protein